MAAAMHAATAAIAGSSDCCIGCYSRLKRSRPSFQQALSLPHFPCSTSPSPSPSPSISSSTTRSIGFRSISHGIWGLSHSDESRRSRKVQDGPVMVAMAGEEIWTGESGLLWNEMATTSSMPRSLAPLDTNSVMMRQRIVFLGSQVDDMSADWIVSQLLLLDAQDPTQDIRMFINSPGGSITAGMAIYDAMRLCRADVSTVCFGLAASMGAFLLCAGTKGKRYAMPNARIMIHQPLGGAQGAAIDVALQVREMIYHKLKLNRIMSRLTGKAEEQIEKDTDRDYFMSAWEAKDYGIVDHVIDDGKPGLVAPIGEAKERKSTDWEYYKVREGKARKDLPSEVKLMPVKQEHR